MGKIIKTSKEEKQEKQKEKLSTREIEDLMRSKLIKERNPLYVFIRSIFLLLLGFYSPIFTIFSVMIGSYTINRISVENNMNAYSSDASCREFSLLIHTTWRAFWNICLQLFLCFVVIAIGCYYNMKWTQLLKQFSERTRLHLHN